MLKDSAKASSIPSTRKETPLRLYKYNQKDKIKKTQSNGKEVEDSTESKTGWNAKRSKIVRGEPTIKKSVSLPQSLAKELAAAAAAKGVSFSRHLIDKLETAPLKNTALSTGSELKTGWNASRSKMVRGEPVFKTKVCFPQGLAKELSTAAAAKGVSFSKHLANTLQPQNR